MLVCLTAHKHNLKSFQIKLIRQKHFQFKFFALKFALRLNTIKLKKQWHTRLVTIVPHVVPALTNAP